MKLVNANSVRASVVADLFAYLTSKGEECGMVTSGSFNFPTCWDGEEGWVEVVVKIPKYSDEEGTELREDYERTVANRAAKAKAAAEAKAAKIARDKAERERKAAERAAAKAAKADE